MSNSLQPHGLQSARLLRPWDSPGKNTGVGCHALLQGIFLTQGSNLHLLLGWRILDHGATRKALPCIGIHWKTRHLTEQGRWKRGSGGRQELRVECEGVSKASACRAEDQVIKNKKAGAGSHTLKTVWGDFHHGPVVRSLHLQCKGSGFHPCSRS